MDRFEFYKEWYYKESDRKFEITNASNIPITINIALGTALFYLVTNYKFTKDCWIDFIFIILSVVFALLIFISCFYLIKSFRIKIKEVNGFEYEELPYAYELEKWYNELLSYNEDNKDKTNEDFENGVLINLINSVQNNTYVNDKKHSYMYKSKQSISLAVASLVLVISMFLINFYTN